MCTDSVGSSIKHMRDAFETFLSVGTLNKAALVLSDKGYQIERYSQGGGRYKRHGQFTVDNLYDLLKNKVYIGIKTYKDKNNEALEVKAVWPSIVDDETFERVQKTLSFNRGRKKPQTTETGPLDCA